MTILPQIRHTDIEHKLLESLVKIQQALMLLEFDRELYDSAEECKRLIETKQYNVAVMGGFNCGKSTIINALLGAEILPTGPIATTATVNRIKYGSQEEQKVVVKFKGGGEKEIATGELIEYVTKLTSDKEARAAEVLEAVVYYPTRFCSNNIDLIDTPGLNDQKDMTAITYDMLDSVDAVIMPIHPVAQFGERETEFVCNKLISSSDINNVVFVVNFMDQVDKDDYENVLGHIKNRIQTGVINKLEGRSEDVIAKAHRLLDNIKVCGISARDALSKDPQKKKESRFKEFEAHLEGSVISRQIDNVSNKAINSIKRIVSEFESQDKKRRDNFERMAETIRLGDSMISEYAHDLDRFIKRVFDEGYNKESANLAKDADEYKQQIKKIFIRELSTVGENTDASIRVAMNKASDDACNAVRQKAPNKRIYEAFKAAVSRLIDYRKEKLGGIFRYLGISGGYFYLSIESLTAYAETVLMKNKKIKFDWSVSPIPAKNLAKVNVIEAVTLAADMSVDNYLRELDKAAREIRDDWFRQFDEDTKTVQNAVVKEIEAQKKELENQKTAYEQLYRVLGESSKAILSECESIRAQSL